MHAQGLVGPTWPLFSRTASLGSYKEQTAKQHELIARLTLQASCSSKSPLRKLGGTSWPKRWRCWLKGICQGTFQIGGDRESQDVEVGRGKSAQGQPGNQSDQSRVSWCYIKWGSLENTTGCLEQAARQGEPDIMGKEDRRGREVSESKRTGKISPITKNVLDLLGQREPYYQFFL